MKLFARGLPALPRPGTPQPIPCLAPGAAGWELGNCSLLSPVLWLLEHPVGTLTS